MTPNLAIRSFSNDQYILDKVFYSNCYRIKSFKDHERKPVVVDIGAHCGYFTFAALALGARKVYAFEPFLENYRMFIKNTSSDHFGQVISYQMGVYVADVPMVFGYPPLIEGSYFNFSEIGPEINATSERTMACPCFSLDTLLSTYIVEDVDLLKISIGYAELNILKGSKNLFSKVTHICGESSLSTERQEELKTIMIDKGFRSCEFYPVEGETNKVMFQVSKTDPKEMFLIKT